MASGPLSGASATQVLGAAELSKSLKELDRKMQTRISRRMVVAGGRILVKGAKAVITAEGRVKTGSMLKNVAIKRQTGTPEGLTEYHLGVRSGRDLSRKSKKKGSALKLGKKNRIIKVYKDDPYYWTFQHFGTKSVKGVRFLEVSLEKNKDPAIQAMIEVMRQEVVASGGKV